MPKPLHVRSRTYLVRPRGPLWLTFWRHQFNGYGEELVLGPGPMERAMRFIAESGKCEGTVRVHWRQNGDLQVVATAAAFVHMSTARELCGA